MKRLMLALTIAIPAPVAQAQDVTRAEGMAAWERIYAVASHPRCTNCHVGPGQEAMWEGLGYGAGTPHGMGVKADESRIGAESMPCRTCHITATRPNDTPHAPPQIDDAWRLPPVELGWHGKESAALCAQMRDPDRTDGMEIADLVDHLLTSPFVAWGMVPGGGREAPGGTAEALAEDMRLWGAAGSPCE